jgi:hypothetical protein
MQRLRCPSALGKKREKTKGLRSISIKTRLIKANSIINVKENHRG